MNYNIFVPQILKLQLTRDWEQLTESWGRCQEIVREIDTFPSKTRMPCRRSTVSRPCMYFGQGTEHRRRSVHTGRLTGISLLDISPKWVSVLDRSFCHVCLVEKRHTSNESNAPLKRSSDFLLPWMPKRTFSFTVDAHFGTDVNATACDLWNILHPFHVCGVAAGSQDDSDLGFRVHMREAMSVPVVSLINTVSWMRSCYGTYCQHGWNPDKEVKGRTYFSSDFLNIPATSRPSVFGAPKPFVHLMSSPWSIRSCPRDPDKITNMNV